jgi:XisH protein
MLTEISCKFKFFQRFSHCLALQLREPDRTLYLAIPIDTFESFLQEIFIQKTIKLYQVKLAIYNPNWTVFVEMLSNVIRVKITLN